MHYFLNMDFMILIEFESHFTEIKTQKNLLNLFH